MDKTAHHNLTGHVGHAHTPPGSSSSSSLCRLLSGDTSIRNARYRRGRYIVLWLQHCVLCRFKPYHSSDCRSGFQQNKGCNFTIRTMCNIVDSNIKTCNAANMCAYIDLSKESGRSDRAKEWDR